MFLACAYPSSVVSLPLSRFASLRRRVVRRAVPLLALAVVALPLAAQKTAESEVLQQMQRQARKHLAGRVSPDGHAAAASLLHTQAEHAALLLHPRAQNYTAAWTPLGPSSVQSASYGNVSGRVTAIALDPNDATGNTVYLGTTGGGVWKSTNAAATSAGGVRFAPVTDTLAVFSQSAGASVTPSLSIGAVAVQPTTTAVVLAGTGDPNDATDSLYGEGLLRSADGGATWTLVQLSQDGTNGQHSFVGLSAAAIAWSASSPSRVVAAFSNSPQAAIVGATNAASVAGLYYSTDAGVTWQMATLYDGASVVQTPQPLGTGQVGNAATSVVWDAQRASFYAAVRGHGYYSSSDGATWKRLTAQPGTSLTATNCPVGANGSGASTCPIFRGTLAVQPVTGDLFALTVDSGNNDQGLWMDACNATLGGACSTSAPTFALRLDGGVMEVGSGSTVITQGDYNLALSAVPSSSGTLLLAGTVDLYRCVLASGSTSCTWRNTTNALNGCAASAAVAPSQHALTGVALSSSDLLVFAGNDGGLWRSTDGIAETGSVCDATDKSHFDNLNAAIGVGGSLAQVVGFAQAPADAETLIVGLGANGTAATSAASVLGAWAQLSAGEGGHPTIDATTPTNWYATIGAGVNFKSCAMGTNCSAANFAGAATIGATQVSGDVALIDVPMLLDPALSANMIAATCRVWRGPAATGATWSGANAISSAWSGAAPCTSTSPLARSLAAGGVAVSSSNAQNSGSQVIYAGLAGVLDGGTALLGGHIFRTTAANIATNTTTWKDVASGAVTNDLANAGIFNPLGFDVSSITVDAHDASGATVYATVMGFGSGTTIVPHVYRSIDSGAHWLNVTSNLPSAPANALAVDPNDANTVYVATDAGVYATSAITTCATASCWNLLGTGLPNAPVTSLAVSSTMPTSDGRLGMLRAGTYGRGLWQTPLLAATSTAQPGMLVSPALLTFDSQQVATLSAAQTVTITSNGSSPLAISSLVVSGDFTETDNCSGQTLAVGASCTVSVLFAPTLSGSRAGSLVVYANIGGGQASVLLSGTATAPASVVLTPVSLTFAATTLNQTSAVQVLTVANTGGNASTLTVPVITGDFAIAANTCATTLAVQTSCSISVTFTPTASGTRIGTLSLISSSGAVTATLSGRGTSSATDTLSPLSLTFGSQVLNTASAAQSVVLTNAGDAALTLVAATTNSSEFAATNGCGATLAGHTSCAISVVFAPSIVGARTAILTVSDQFRAQSLTLSGTGLAPAGVSLTPTSLAFGEIGVGLSSQPQVVTLTNNGGVTLTISSLAPTGDYVLVSTNCGTSLSAGSACSATLLFAPTAAGERAGSLVLNSSIGMKSVALSGVGADFTLSTTGTTSASLGGSSGSATYALLLSSVSGLASTISLSCSGAPAHATCAVSPSAATLGSTLNVSVVVATGIASMGHNSRDLLPWSRSTLLYAFTMPWLLCMLRVRRRRWIAALPLLFMMISGCGASRTLPSSGSGSGSTSTPTPSGTYTLTVSATAAGITHSVPLVLTVN